MKKRTSARRRAELRARGVTSIHADIPIQVVACTPSKYISPCSIQPGDRVVLCCRVSGRMQARGGNDKDQEANLRREVEKRGGVIVAVVRHTGSGWEPDWLVSVAEKARAEGAKLLAETVDRFIRHPDYHSKRNPDAQATDAQLADLRRLTLGVELMTLVHPDAPLTDARSHQRKRGQQAKERKGGRPRKKKPGYKKERRRLNLSKVFWMSKCGYSVRQIAARAKMPKTTVQDYIKKLRG